MMNKQYMKLPRVKVTCPSCGNERLVPKVWLKRTNFTGYCLKCIGSWRGSWQHGSNHPLWKGGINRDQGYIVLYIPNEPLFEPLIKQGVRQIREHRLVMSKHLGRLLTNNEIVHHLNGIRDDNRIENLVLVSRKFHEKGTYIKVLQDRVRELEERVQELEEEIY